MQCVELADIHQLEVLLVVTFDGDAAADGEIEVHDWELVGGADHVSEQAGVEEVDATEGKEPEACDRQRLVRGDDGIVLTLQDLFHLRPGRLHFTGLDVDPSHEQHVLVEDEIALRLAPTHEQLCASHLMRNAAVGAHHFLVKIIELGQVDIAQNVDIVDENRQVGAEEVRRLTQSATCIEELVGLITDLYVESEVVVLFQIVDNLIGEVMDIDDEMVEAGIPQFIDDALNKRHAAYWHHGFWHRVGKRLEAGTHARGKYHCLHHSDSSHFLPCEVLVIQK